jgi:8-oxo-dGTP diphosphatase
MTTDGAGNGPMTANEGEWCDWVPADRATLVFVVRHDETLLIRKKRGLGAGKINGPGGKLEPGESSVACAIREVEEELCVTPTGLAQAGELQFQFTDGYAIHVDVFRADGCRGEARETDEAVPLWTPLDRIPYDEMWEDDRFWLPLLFAGETFRGRFVFEGDRMLDFALVEGHAPFRRHPAENDSGSTSTPVR